MANTCPYDQPGNHWLAHSAKYGTVSLWYAVDSYHDELLISSSGNSDKLHTKGGWASDVTFRLITEDQALACIAACELGGPDAWQAYTRSLFDD